MKKANYRKPIVQKRRRLRLIEESSFDDDIATITSKLDTKKLKTTLYMTDAKDSAIPDKESSRVKITHGGNTDVTHDAQSILDTSIPNVVSSAPTKSEIHDSILGAEITSPSQ